MSPLPADPTNSCARILPESLPESLPNRSRIVSKMLPTLHETLRFSNVSLCLWIPPTVLPESCPNRCPNRSRIGLESLAKSYQIYMKS